MTSVPNGRMMIMLEMGADRHYNIGPKFSICHAKP